MNELNQKYSKGISFYSAKITWTFLGRIRKREKNNTVLSNVQNDYGRHITKQLQPNNIHYQNCRAHYTHIIYFYDQNRLVYAFRSQLCASIFLYVYGQPAPKSKMFIEVYCGR